MSTLPCKYASHTTGKTAGKNVQFIHGRKRFTNEFKLVAYFFFNFFTLFVLVQIHSVILHIIQTTHSNIMDLIMPFCAIANRSQRWTLNKNFAFIQVGRD